MQEPQPSTFRNFSFINNSNSFEATEQLAALLSQHALVAEQLRGLSHEQSSVEFEIDATWNVSATQVARLRFEVESFKRSFAPIAKATDAVFVADDSVEILLAKR